MRHRIDGHARRSRDEDDNDDAGDGAHLLVKFTKKKLLLSQRVAENARERERNANLF